MSTLPFGGQLMKSKTGGWVAGDDFFGREDDLDLLETSIRNGNHVLLTGPRRMGKTSVAQEIGRRLSEQGWTFLYLDVEHADTPEELVVELARRVYASRSFAKRHLFGLGRWVSGQGRRVRKMGAGGVGVEVEVRKEVESGTWRQRGSNLLEECAAAARPVLLVLDELPLFLKRLSRVPDGLRSADLFLSWLRGSLQMIPRDSLAVLISGSTGLTPLVERLGLSDRINYLRPYALGPWTRDESIACFEKLAASCGISCDAGVAIEVYEQLGSGNPHHVQSFFAALQVRAAKRADTRITRADVDVAYRETLLRPGAQNDLTHYEQRLEQSLDPEEYRAVRRILAETAIRGVFTPAARRELADSLNGPGVDGSRLVRGVLDLLQHDGYLIETDGGLRFESRLLRDWFARRLGGESFPPVSGSDSP